MRYKSSASCLTPHRSTELGAGPPSPLKGRGLRRELSRTVWVRGGTGGAISTYGTKFSLTLRSCAMHYAVFATMNRWATNGNGKMLVALAYTD
jgi:hypothetical protein